MKERKKMLRIANLMTVIGRQLTNNTESLLFKTPRLIAEYSSYKSAISLDKLYPDVNLDLTAKLSSKKNDSSDEQTFSGYIPIEKLEISHALSSKPGGQHVNKSIKNNLRIFNNRFDTRF